MIAPVIVSQLNLRKAESFPFCQEISKPWGGLEPILCWCKQELQGEWRWELIDISSDQRPGRYKFYFDLGRDCTAFALRWD